MRILFIINTPAQVYTWQYIMLELIKKGHDIRILVRDYGGAPLLLKDLGFQSLKFGVGGAQSANVIGKIVHFQRCLALSKGFNPSMVIGFGIDAAFTAAWYKKPCIVFIDDEPTIIQNYLTRLLGSVIITPKSFRQSLGSKQIRINGYKELAYLHPDVFKPDPLIFNDLKIDRNKKYVIFRLNAFDAIHDIRQHGFSISDQFRLVDELKEYAQIFISPEGKLSKDLEKYRLPIPYHRIHHALYYAQLLITDSQTITTEAAILGTPVVRSNSWVGPRDMGNFVELEKKYDLIYSYKNTDQAIRKAIELIKQPDLKERWGSKREILLADKINVTQFMVNFVETYPEGLKKSRDTGNLL